MSKESVCVRIFLVQQSTARRWIHTHLRGIHEWSQRVCGVVEFRLSNSICASPKATVVNAVDCGSGQEETRVRRYAMALLAQCVRYVHCRTKTTCIKWLFFGKL